MNKFEEKGYKAAKEGIQKENNPFRLLGKKFEVKKIQWDIGWDIFHKKLIK